MHHVHWAEEYGQFKVACTPDHEVSFETYKGRYVSAGPGTMVQSTSLGATERFVPIMGFDGKWLFETSSGTVVYAPPGTGDALLHRDGGGDDAQFTVSAG